MVWCWASVVDVGPISNHHLLNVYWGGCLYFQVNWGVQTTTYPIWIIYLELYICMYEARKISGPSSPNSWVNKHNYGQHFLSAAGLFDSSFSIFSSFEAGIANAISSFKWRQTLSFINNRHLSDLLFCQKIAVTRWMGVLGALSSY